MSLPVFKKLSALDEMAVDRAARELRLALLSRGLAEEDAWALGHNTALAWYAVDWKDGPGSPFGLLESLSLREIGALCEAYREWEAERGGFGESGSWDAAE